MVWWEWGSYNAVYDLRTGKLPIFCEFPGIADAGDADIHGWPVPIKTSEITDTHSSATWPEVSGWNVVSTETFGLEGLNKFFLHPLMVTVNINATLSTTNGDFPYFPEPDADPPLTWFDVCEDEGEPYENPAYDYLQSYEVRGNFTGESGPGPSNQYHSHAVHPLQRYACGYRWGVHERPWIKPELDVVADGDLNDYDVFLQYSLCNDTGVLANGDLTGPFDPTKYRMVFNFGLQVFGKIPCSNFDDYIGQQFLFTYPQDAPVDGEWNDGYAWISGSRTTLNFMGLSFPAAKVYRTILGETNRSNSAISSPADIYAKRTSQSISASFSTDFATPITNLASNIAANEGGAGFNNAALIPTAL